MAKNHNSILAGLSSVRRALVQNGCLLGTMLALSFPASAFEDLTAVQQLVYETAHLKNTQVEDVVSYNYAATLPETDPVVDQAQVKINAKVDAERRDVSLDFLSDERHMFLPDFDGYRGNPIIIAMLEHLAQSLARDTGGGVIYFRNRIRDALASETTAMTSIQISHNDKSIEATQITLEPFTTDPYLAEQPHYKSARIVMLFSESVPGGVVTISMEGGKGTENEFNRTLSLL